MRALLCLLGAACLGAALAQLGACVQGDDCDCPPMPELPAVQAALPIREAQAYTAAGDDDVLPVDPRGGTLEITGEQVILRYDRDGTAHEVVYDVVR